MSNTHKNKIAALEKKVATLQLDYEHQVNVNSSAFNRITDIESHVFEKYAGEDGFDKEEILRNVQIHAENADLRRENTRLKTAIRDMNKYVGGI